LVRPLLSERHRSPETIEFVRLVVAMLMTFAALVLGLLTSSAKSSFDKVGNEIKTLAVELHQLDRSLRALGDEPRPIRDLLHTDTETAIATTWTRKPKPPGDNYPTQLPVTGGAHLESPVMTDMLTSIENDIRQLEPHDPMHRRLAGTCVAQFE